MKAVYLNRPGTLIFIVSSVTVKELYRWNEVIYPGEEKLKEDLIHQYFKYNDEDEVTSLNIIFNQQDCKKLYENIIEDKHENNDGTTTYIKNLEEIYKGFRIIEREEIVRACDGRVIKKQKRKFGIATTRSADRAFRKAGLSSTSIEDAKANLALIGARDLLSIGSR